MTRNVIWQDHEPALQPVDETVDHVRGSAAGRLILEYGDYECPYSRQAFRAIERVEQELGGGVRFCLRPPCSGRWPDECRQRNGHSQTATWRRLRLQRAAHRLVLDLIEAKSVDG